MKKVEAIIRKSKFEDVKNALHDVGIDFLTFWDVTGIGNEKTGAMYRATIYETRFIQRTMLSFVCRNEFVEKAIQAILAAGSTGELGDGKIFISEVTDSIRIRTGERGDDSLFLK